MRTSLVRVTLLLLCAFLFAGVVCSGLSVGGSERDGSLQPARLVAFSSTGAARARSSTGAARARSSTGAARARSSTGAARARSSTGAARARSSTGAANVPKVRAPATKKTNSRKTTGSSSLTKPPATSKSTKVTKQRRKAKLITLTQLEKIAVKYEQQKNKPVKGVKPVQKSTKTAKNAAKSTAARALSELSSRVSTPPVAAAGIIPAGLVAQRMALRPGHGGDSQVLKGFHYTFDQSGRVTQVTGMVTFAKRGPLSDAAYLICDRMYFSDTNQTRDRDMWQTGHMLASALGGSDDDPQNFFPQHRNSNSAGGKWWRIESIARQGSVVLEKFKDKDGSQCKVQVTPTFEYAKPTWSATHGAYYVEATKACLDQITPAVQSTLSSYALIFSHLLSDPTATQNDIFQKSGNVGQRVGITWINEYDKADPKVNPGLFQ